MGLGQIQALTPKPRPQSPSEAAKVAKVSRQTLNGWKNHSVPFIQALRIEQNRLKETKLKNTLEKHALLKEAALETLLKGIKAGDLVSSRWYLEKYALSGELKLLEQHTQLQVCDENLEPILLEMAKARVKKALDKEGIEDFERAEIESKMIKKVHDRLIKEYTNMEIE